MWRCRNCGKGVDDQFDTCWSCGEEKQGDEELISEKEVDEQIQEEEEQNTTSIYVPYHFKTLLLFPAL